MGAKGRGSRVRETSLSISAKAYDDGVCRKWNGVRRLEAAKA